jgi:rSAM/selenodomain-associated transferase 1
VAHALTLFARAPVPGETKTRLIPALGPEGAARLYEAFLEDALERFAGSFETTLSCAGDVTHPSLKRLARTYGVALRTQCEGDLGARMSHDLILMNRSHGNGIIVGTDIPTLPLSLVVDAFRALERADVVLGPTSDGGYYLVGARGAWPDLFRGVRFSSPHALADTLAAAEGAGAEVELLSPWYDIDEPEDLRLLRAHLGLNPPAAPHTSTCLFDHPAADR